MVSGSIFWTRTLNHKLTFLPRLVPVGAQVKRARLTPEHQLLFVLGRRLYQLVRPLLEVVWGGYDSRGKDLRERGNQILRTNAERVAASMLQDACQKRSSARGKGGRARPGHKAQRQGTGRERRLVRGW